MTNAPTNQTKMVKGSDKDEAAPLKTVKLIAKRDFRLPLDETGKAGAERHIRSGEVFEVDEKTAESLTRVTPGPHPYLGEFYENVRTKVQLAERHHG